MRTNLKGEKVFYVPSHANYNINHPDVESGVITSRSSDGYFVRYGDELHSKCTNKSDLFYPDGFPLDYNNISKIVDKIFKQYGDMSPNAKGFLSANAKRLGKEFDENRAEHHFRHISHGADIVYLEKDTFLHPKDEVWVESMSVNCNSGSHTEVDELKRYIVKDSRLVQKKFGYNLSYLLCDMETGLEEWYGLDHMSECGYYQLIF